MIHHNQLLLTKFGRISLWLINRWRKSAAQLQINAPLAEKTGDEIELFCLSKQKWRNSRRNSLLVSRRPIV